MLEVIGSHVPVGHMESGFPCLSATTREQVASNPRPFTWLASTLPAWHTLLNTGIICHGAEKLCMSEQFICED